MGEVSLPQSGRLAQSSLSSSRLFSQSLLTAHGFFILDVDQSTVLVIPDTAIFHGKRIVRNERKGRTSHDPT